MKRISFNPRFVNKAGNDVISGKIHTIRQNYDFWKRFEGQEVALFTWEGKPYQKGSKQKVFCKKKIIHVQATLYLGMGNHFGIESEKPFPPDFEIDELNDGYLPKTYLIPFDYRTLAKNDGFQNEEELKSWFRGYPTGRMAILHFTDFRY